MPREYHLHLVSDATGETLNTVAKAVCAQCPVLAACRAHALAVQEPYGIWGGLSEEERFEIISKVQRQSHSFTA